MSLLAILSIINLIPAIYPINRIIKKSNINMFDVLIIFLSINFSIIPLTHLNLLNENDEVHISVFIVYFSLVLSLLVTDLLWRSKKNNYKNIINISLFLKSISEIRISKLGYLIIFLILLVLLFYYIPYATVIAHFEDKEIPKESYIISSYLLVLTNVLSITSTIIWMNFIFRIKNNSMGIIDGIITIIFIVICFLCPRRDLVFFIIEFAVIFYSITRDLITKKFVLSLLCGMFFIYYVYFPFYNVLRNNSIEFDKTKPLTSLYSIFSESISNFSSNKEGAKESTDERSINVYLAVYKLLKYTNEQKNGEITIKEIDYAIPKVINPNKGDGSQGILEEMTKQYSDQGDSYLLQAIADFRYFGGLYALILYLLIFYAYNYYQKLLYNYTGCGIIPAYILFCLFKICWDIEGVFSSSISWFFSSIPILFFLYLLKMKRIIFIKFI